MKASGQTFYYHYNRHGDVIAMTDVNGSMVASYEYDAWGNVTKREEQGISVDNPYGYAGYLYDEELNMYYLMARYYHPEHGVFLSMDPDPGDADDPITQNGYSYASNNPVMMVDPDGHWVWLVVNAGFAAYDGYKAYKAGGNWKQVAWAAGKNFIGIGKVSKVSKVTKVISKGCNCFTAGTKVLTDEGEKNIEDIEVGDKVLAKDENNSNGELAYKEVTALYRNQRDDIIKLHVGKQIIETTDNHPFWVEGKGWVFADELQVGDKLQKADGSNLTIDKVEFVKLDVPVSVYNFTVADYHTYYVTDIGIWVHNTKCSTSKAANKLTPNLKAVGAHTVYKRGANGKKLKEMKATHGTFINNTTYDYNPLNQNTTVHDGGQTYYKMRT